MKFRRMVAIAAAVVVLAGCWPMAGQGPDRAAYNPVERQIRADTVAQLDRVWTADVDAGTVGDPVTSTAGVHVADDAAVYGFDAATGRRLWRFPAGEGRAIDDPSAQGGEVLIGREATGDEPHVVWVDAATGEVTQETRAWRVAGRRGNRAFTASVWQYWRDPRIWVITMASQDLRDPEAPWWSSLWYSTGGEQPPQPVVTVGSDAAYHAGVGSLRQDATECDLQAANALRAVPLTDIEVMCGSYVRPAWALVLDGTTAVPPVLSPDEGLVYTGTDAGTVYAVDAATGTQRWTADVGAAVLDSPALAGRTLYVPTAAGLVVLPAHGCQAPTCVPAWRSADRAAVDQQPAVAGGVVVAGDADGSVQAYLARGCRTRSCRPLWTDRLGAPVTGAPAIANGHLYVGTADGRLTAYGLPARRPD